MAYNAGQSKRPLSSNARGQESAQKRLTRHEAAPGYGPPGFAPWGMSSSPPGAGGPPGMAGKYILITFKATLSNSFI